MGLPAFLAVTSLASQGASFYEGHKAKQSAKAQAAIEREQQRVEGVKRRREILARVREANASRVNVAEQTGTGGSTGVLGSAGALESSGGAKVGEYTTAEVFAGAIGAEAEKQLKAKEQASVFGLIGSIADVGATATGGYGDLFGAERPAKPKSILDGMVS